MSKMIPQSVVDVFRNNVNISVDNFGIDCDLYLLTNATTLEDEDIYKDPDDMEFTHYTTKVWIEFNPNIYRLRKLGVHSEDELPIIARFKYEATSDAGATSTLNIIKGSYVKVAIQYIPSEYEGYDEFEVVDVFTGEMHDAILNRIYLLAPRRLPLTE